MEYRVKDSKSIASISIDDLLKGNSKLRLFEYSQQEHDDFSAGFDPSSIKEMIDSVSTAMKVEQPDQNLVRYLLEYIQTLTASDLKKFENHVASFTDHNPNMLWNMLTKADRMLYKKPDLFYEWLSTLSDDEMDTYIYRAAEGKKLHPVDIYKQKESSTRVEILDGYIAISSSNLKALDRFRDRVLKTNDCSYEHRIKITNGVKIHSYVFNMNNTSD